MKDEWLIEDVWENLTDKEKADHVRFVLRKMKNHCRGRMCGDCKLTALCKEVRNYRPCWWGV